MRNLFAVVTLLSLVLSGGCGGSTISGLPIHSEGGSNAPPLTSFDKEAVEQAMDHWKPTTIGDSSYIRFVRRSTDPGFPNTGRAIIQLRQVSVKCNPATISKADQLNGIEWQGSVELCYEAARYYVQERLARPSLSGYFPPDPPDTAWSPWEGGRSLAAMSFQRVSRKWRTVASESHIDRVGTCTYGAAKNDDAFEKVDPSDLPK
ncbi:MAG: hypothetical protein ACLQNE_08205 [Thermoguttaceae bacterium]